MDTSYGIIFGLIAMVGFGLSNALFKVPIKSIGTKRMIFFRNIFTSLMLLLVLLVFQPTAALSLENVLIVFLISFVAYIPLVTFVRALSVGKVGVVVPIANSSVIFTILFSAIFFREALTMKYLLSVSLIIAGIILISLDFKHLRDSHLFKVSSGVPFALLTCLLWGFLYFLLKIPVSAIGPILTSFIVEGGIMVFSGMNLGLSKLSFRLPEKRTLVYVILIAAFGVMGSLFYNLGIMASDVSLVAALTFSNPLVTSLYGRFVYKERLTSLQWAAIALILAGVVIVSYS